MATTFNLEIKKTPTSKGKYQVYIRITKDRVSKRIVTSVALDRLADWNPKAKGQNWVRSSSRQSVEWNDALTRELEEARRLYRDDKQASAELLVTRMKNQYVGKSFLAYAKSYTDSLSATGKTNAKHYKSFCVKLESFLASKGRTDINFSEITPSLLSDFESYLLKETNSNSNDVEARLNPNYVRAILVKFRSLLNKAIAGGLMPEDRYPFGRNKHPMPAEVGSKRESLDQAEIDAIAELEYPEGSMLWKVKNAFLFSYYCAGIRVGDLLRLRWDNVKDGGECLEYTMNKNHKQRKFALMPQAKEILVIMASPSSRGTDYIFPFLDNSAVYARYQNLDTIPVDVKQELFKKISSKNAQINDSLCRVAVDAGIDKHISFHVSRHSFADIAVKKGLPSKFIQEALAHSSLSTTERYLHSFSSQEMDSSLQKVFTSPEDAHKAEEDVLLKALKAMSASDIERLLAKLK